MIKKAIKKIFKTSNERELRKLEPLVKEINALKPEMEKLTDDELKAYTPKFKERLKKGETLDDLLVEAFAVVREAGKRVLKMSHFDVQLMGGMVLHQGKIAEMKTGEGKTLVATLPAYLNALEGKGVHVVTVNDYLAERDAEWMGEIYKFLGLSVGVILHKMEEYERREAYDCDITYGTNNEFGFDYLRDNMKFDAIDMVQRDFHFAIVDEVDSILIDEARTPLIISGPTEKTTTFYYNVNLFVKKIKNDTECYEVDEKSKTAVLTEKGVKEAEEFFNLENLFDVVNMDILHQINQSLKAHFLFSRDMDYVVKENQVVIVDEFTGRMTPGRRYSDGLHQALEAKENVRIERESQTYASITFQNYFRMYKTLAGMTGTAATEATEFHTIYKLEVVEIPTNKTLRRKEYPDIIYGSTEEKWDAVVEEIKRLYESGQPVLVGTISIENSELLNRRLKKEKIPHEVLNAKFHDMEAAIVAQAGRKGAVTIATNMAGRGTDIVLGGNPAFMLKKVKREGFEGKSDQKRTPENIKMEAERKAEQEHEEVVNLGGLYILGTERHEARRIDNQLRGRSGRQGDPGCSRFYISMEDDLMKILGSDRIRGLLTRVGLHDGVPIENKLITRTIENAQKQIESQNFTTRKHLLEYDDAMNIQRKYIYNLRREILMGKDVREDIVQLIEDLMQNAFENFKEDKQKKSVKEKNKPDIEEDIDIEEEEDLEEEERIEIEQKIKDFDLLNSEIRSKFYLDVSLAKIKKNFDELTKEDFKEMPRVFVKEILRDYISRVFLKREIDSGAKKAKKEKKSRIVDIIEKKENQFELLFDKYFDGSKEPGQWDYPALHREISSQFDIDIDDVKISSYKYIDEAIKDDPGLISRERTKNALWNYIEAVLEDRSAPEEKKKIAEENEPENVEEKASKNEEDTSQITKFGFGQVFDRYCEDKADPSKWDYDSLCKEIDSNFHIDLRKVRVRLDKYLKEMAEADFYEISRLKIRKDLWLHVLIAYDERTFTKDSDESEDDEPEEETDPNLKEIPDLTEDTFKEIFKKYLDKSKEPSQWDRSGLQEEIKFRFNLDVAGAKITSGNYIEAAVNEDFENFSQPEVEDSLLNYIRSFYKEKELLVGPKKWKTAERHVMLQVIDSQWKDHLLTIDHLKEGIGLRGYAQKDPLIEFKHESFRKFEDMQIRIGEDVIKYLFVLNEFDYSSIEKVKQKKKSILAKPSSKLPSGKKKKSKSAKKKKGKK